MESTGNAIPIDVDSIIAISQVNKNAGQYIIFCQGKQFPFKIKLSQQELLEKLAAVGVLEELAFAEIIGRKNF